MHTKLETFEKSNLFHYEQDPLKELVNHIRMCLISGGGKYDLYKIDGVVYGVKIYTTQPEGFIKDTPKAKYYHGFGVWSDGKVSVSESWDSKYDYEQYYFPCDSLYYTMIHRDTLIKITEQTKKILGFK